MPWCAVSPAPIPLLAATPDVQWLCSGKAGPACPHALQRTLRPPDAVRAL